MLRASARHILVDTKEECLTLMRKISSGAEFSSMAKKHSNCPSKVEGGALGSFYKGQMVPEFDDVAFNAQLHTLQGPVRTQFGYHVLEITERTE